VNNFQSKESRKKKLGAAGVRRRLLGDWICFHAKLPTISYILITKNFISIEPLALEMAQADGL
jgi:hypothetical protein